MAQIIMIIGLPGSGKTYLSNKYSDEYIIYDDYLSTIWNGKLVHDIETGRKVCINDPRLCGVQTFTREFQKYVKLVGAENIQIITFENNPQQCALNKPDRKYDIEKFSKIYDLKNYENNTIIKVFIILRIIVYLIFDIRQMLQSLLIIYKLVHLLLFQLLHQLITPS